MSITNEKLQEVLREIESKRTFAITQLQTVRTQMASRTRERRMLELSDSEMQALPAETKVYEGVGKMFVLTPTSDVRKRLDKDTAAVDKELENLKKKLVYLETTQKNAENALQGLLSGGGG